VAISYYSPHRVILSEVNLPVAKASPRLRLRCWFAEASPRLCLRCWLADARPEEDPKLIYYAVALMVIVIDQLSKWLIVHNLTLYESRSVIGDFFLITSHRNSGAAFSILEGQQWFFYIVTIIVLIGIVWYMQKVQKANKRLLAVSLSFLLGGALGNFIDRVMYGEVVDFLQFNFVFKIFGQAVNYTFAIFNIADTAITVGVVLIFIDALRGWLKERRGNRNESYGS
jgi:signal peptidase II